MRKREIVFTLFVGFYVCVSVNCYGTDYTNNGVLANGSYSLNFNDWFINNGVVEDSYNIDVGMGNAFIKNTGTIKSSITGTNSTSQITQVITGVNDMKFVPTDSSVAFDILINHGGIYSLSQLKSLAGDAKIITVDFDRFGGDAGTKAVFVADSGFNGVFDIPIKDESYNSQITLTNSYLDNIGDSDVILRFKRLQSHGLVSVVEENGNNINDYYWETCGENLCLKRKQSNYYTETRKVEQHAAQVAQIGVQSNPEMLLRPMIAKNQYELLSVYDFSDEFFLSVSPEYSGAKDFQNSGVRLNSGTKIGGSLSVGMTAYVTKTKFQNEVSDFKADIYGGNLHFKYDISEILFLRGIGGASFAKIKCDDVVNGDSVINNPNATGYYGGLDFGGKFNFESGLFISPFVGYYALTESVVDVRENDSFARIGSDIGFNYFMDGVGYNYVLRAGITSSGHFDAGIGVGVLTVADKIGGSVSVGVMDTDFGLSGTVSANVRFGF